MINDFIALLILENTLLVKCIVNCIEKSKFYSLVVKSDLALVLLQALLHQENVLNY